MRVEIQPDEGKRFTPRRGRFTVLALLMILCAPTRSIAMDDPGQYFKTSCGVCHTIGGGRLVGPDLKDVTQRQDRSWLLEFIQNPQAKFDAEDPYALEILAESNGVPMIPIAGMTAEIAGSMLDLIERESGLERSAFAGPKQLPEPADEDRAAGEALFMGRSSLAQGGPACVSCHTVAGIGGFGGGRLGPDLTKAADRFGGLSGLYAWLEAPPTEQMKANFAGHPFDEAELFALAAYLDSAAGRSEITIFSDMNRLGFAAFGLLGALCFMVAFGGLWGGRMRGVRKPMVKAAKISS
jgi:mono/diheme cytochrome c family protein